MNTKNIKSIEGKIHSLFSDYETQIYEQVVHEAFTKIVKPYLEKYSLNFVAGNGTYLVTWTNKTPINYVENYKDSSTSYGHHIDLYKLENKEGKLFAETLSTMIEGMNNSLGDLMPEYISE